MAKKESGWAYFVSILGMCLLFQVGRGCVATRKVEAERKAAIKAEAEAASTRPRIYRPALRKYEFGEDEQGRYMKVTPIPTATNAPPAGSR